MPAYLFCSPEEQDSRMPVSAPEQRIKKRRIIIVFVFDSIG